MEAISNINAGNSASSVQGVKKTNNSEVESADTETAIDGGAQATSSEFYGFLSMMLGKESSTEVNEEELFARVIQAKLLEDGEEVSDFYGEKFKELSATMARADGYVPVEDVAKAALKATVEAGMVEMERAEEINSVAFASAQLDEIHEALYDGRGDTKAVASVEEAMNKLKLMIDQIDSGSLTLDPRSLDIPSNKGAVVPSPAMLGSSSASASSASYMEGSEEISSELLEATDGKARKFSWKHISDSDGKLAILIPSALSDDLMRVEIFDNQGKLLESGKFSKTTGDDRAVYRFSKPGADYGKDLDVVITKNNMDHILYHIDDGSERTSEWLSDSPDAAKEKIDQSEKLYAEKFDNGASYVSNPQPSEPVSSSAAESTYTGGGLDQLVGLVSS